MYAYFFEPSKCFLLLNKQTITSNTRLPISDIIIITDTTPRPAEQLKQEEVRDGGKDDGKTVVNTIQDVSR